MVYCSHLPHTVISRKVVRKSVRDNSERYSLRSWRDSCTRGTFLTCIPSLLVAPPPNQHSIPTQATKGIVDGFESTVLQRKDVCLLLLKENNKSRFDSFSVRNSVFIIPLLPFGIVACTVFSNKLFQNSCMVSASWLWRIRRGLEPIKTGEIFWLNNKLFRSTGPGSRESPISAKPGSKFLFHFCILPLYALPRVTFYIFITKTWSKYTTSILYVPGTCYDKRTLLKIWLNPGLNLTIYSGTGVTEEIRLTPFSTDAIVTAQISSGIKQLVNKKRLAIWYRHFQNITETFVSESKVYLTPNRPVHHRMTMVQRARCICITGVLRWATVTLRNPEVIIVTYKTNP